MYRPLPVLLAVAVLALGACSDGDDGGDAGAGSARDGTSDAGDAQDPGGTGDDGSGDGGGTGGTDAAGGGGADGSGATAGADGGGITGGADGGGITGGADGDGITGGADGGGTGGADGGGGGNTGGSDDPGGGGDGSDDGSPVLGSPDDPLDDPDEVEVLVPALPGDSNAMRLVDALHEAVGAAVLALERSVSSGAPLSDFESDCLAAYEPALGEPVLGLDCERPYAIGERALLRVTRAAFSPSASCTESVAAGGIDGCRLAFARVSIAPEFVAPPSGPARLIDDGAEIRYAIEAPTLGVESRAEPLQGAFRCDIDLVLGTELPGVGIGDCDAIMRDVADRLELLLDVL